MVPDSAQMSLFANSTGSMAVLATWLPLAAFALIMIGLRRHPRAAATVSILTVATMLATAVGLLFNLYPLAAPLVFSRTWLAGNLVSISYGVLLDPLSLLMFTTVALISLLVQIYSLGYMAGDPGFGRYYGFMSLFAWAMGTLALSSNVVQLYIFWELVGVASYLLIGFWFEKFSASSAGKKAFLMTRLGDIAFLLGLLMLIVYVQEIDILGLNTGQAAGGLSTNMMTLTTLLIFGGIMGKSAQFPLLTWLPDAMEGPTPVSALLHSATMVAAGVFLMARLFPFFSVSPQAMTVCLTIGTLSMLLASTMAMVSSDIKQVWAYSTISQLGFMIMGLAAGGYVAGVFHLTTHAAFKALLFLCAGVFIHAYGTNDIRTIGQSGGRTRKLLFACLVIGAAALSGLPPFSGFFSKELILGALAQKANPIWAAAGLVGTFLTAYYTFRLVFLIAFPREKTPDHQTGHQTYPQSHAGHDDHGQHGNDWRMLIPVALLAGLTLLMGFFEGSFAHFMTPGHSAVTVEHHGPSLGLMISAIALALSGLGLAWVEFGRAKAVDQTGFVEKVGWLHRLFANRWYIDHFYRWAVNRLVDRGVSEICARGDRQVIDVAIDGLGRGTIRSGHWLARLHLGALQPKLITLFMVVLFLALYAFF